jgi:hypothetical protein
MTCTSSRSLARGSTIGLLAVVAALALLLVTATVALADTVHIYDAANVLNVSQVQGDASSLPYPIDIYTTNTFNGSTSAFDQRTSGHLTSSRLIVIAIDTHHKHLTIVGGKSVPLSSSQYSSAVNAFINNYSSNKDYTAATIAAIDSLKSSLGAGSSPVPGASGGGLFSGLFWPCCLGLVILVIVGIIIAAARGVFRRMFGFGGRPRGVPYQQPYQQPYNQGYPPNYGPGYNQGQGINPLVAGGLGAAGGGLIGYELGKEAGENESREQGQGGDFGGGSSGDFGGGSSGDFGGGGGGSSGDFGGGGGGDFGGGSSGNF